jgi:hypothetical protein
MTQVNHQYVFQSVVQSNVILAHLEILHIDPIVQIRVHVILLKTRNLDVRMPLQIKNQFFVILIIKYYHNPLLCAWYSVSRLGSIGRNYMGRNESCREQHTPLSCWSILNSLVMCYCFKPFTIHWFKV